MLPDGFDMIAVRAYLSLAEAASANSTCKSRKIGAVLVARNGDLLGVGFNGPPGQLRQCRDKCNKRLHGDGPGQSVHCPAIHAEERALLNALAQPSYTKQVKGSILFCECGVPCGRCLVHLLAAGVSAVVCTTTQGVGTYYDVLSQEIVRDGALGVYQFTHEGQTGTLVRLDKEEV